MVSQLWLQKEEFKKTKLIIARHKEAFHTTQVHMGMTPGDQEAEDRSKGMFKPEPF